MRTKLRKEIENIVHNEVRGLLEFIGKPETKSVKNDKPDGLIQYIFELDEHGGRFNKKYRAGVFVLLIKRFGIESEVFDLLTKKE